MKIAVLSDTHIKSLADKLPDEIYEAFKGVDLIIHAGDIGDSSLIEELSGLARTEAVCGNTDSDDLRRSFPESKIIDVEGKKIGIFHGKGSRRTILDVVKWRFRSEKLDIIIFGHSHAPFSKIIDETLYFNPGSATDKSENGFVSYGIIDVGNEIVPKIIKV